MVKTVSSKFYIASRYSKILTSRQLSYFSTEGHGGQPLGWKSSNRVMVPSLKICGFFGGARKNRGAPVIQYSSHVTPLVASHMWPFSNDFVSPELKRVAGAGVQNKDVFLRSSANCQRSPTRIRLGCNSYLNKKWIQQTSKQVCTKLCILYDIVYIYIYAIQCIYL